MSVEHKSTGLSTADLANVGSRFHEDPAGDPRSAAPQQRPESALPEAAGNPIMPLPSTGTIPETESGAEGTAIRREALMADHAATREIGSESRQAGANATNPPVALFDQRMTKDFQSRWNEIQVGFVDEPRRAVERADNLVAETIKHLADSFASERRNLEDEWERAGDPSTEALRLALQRYRSFFNRLLAM